MTEPTKVCARCSNEWPLSAFAVSRKALDGKRPWCRPCDNEYSKARYRERLAENPEAERRRNREVVARHRARGGDERNKAMVYARDAALRRLANVCPAEFAAVYDAVLRERGLELRQ